MKVGIPPDVVRSAKAVTLIEVKVLRGDGETDPVREVTQFWNMQGEFQGEHDPVTAALIRTIPPMTRKP